jgi:hypothetical protein
MMALWAVWTFYTERERLSSWSVSQHRLAMAQFDLNETLRAAGIKTEELRHIQFAPRGVVGKTSYVAAVALGVVGVVAWRVKSEEALLAVGGGVLLLFLIYFFGVLLFARKNPGLALLEGAQLLQWRQMEITTSDTQSVADTAPTTPSKIE